MLNSTKRYGIRTILKQEYNNATFRGTRNTTDLNSQFSTYFTIERIELENVPINYRQTRDITPGVNNYNFFAIPTALLNRSPAVKQTKGWGNGDFDPYE